VGQLFASAGDTGHALDQFQRALRVAPDNATALAGAGQAAFQAGDYMLARRYLHAASDRLPGVKETTELADLVLSSDPLAARIGASARHRRLADNFSYANQRLTACLEHRLSSQPSADEFALRDEAQAFERQLSSSRLVEEDTIESAVELTARIERAVVHGCAPSTPLDHALILIAQHHGMTQQ
jgi:hypothetical protein